VNERLGILGGAFNPIHNGHLILAEQAHNQLQLDSVLFVPSFQPPENHKSITTSFEQRCEMVEAALQGIDYFRVSRLEEKLEAPTYTVRLLEALKVERPEASFSFLMGSDSLRQLDSWYQPEKLSDLAQLVVAHRPGHEECESKYEIKWLDMPLIEISASDLRARVRHGRSLRFLVPDPVIAYIEDQQLYRF